MTSVSHAVEVVRACLPDGEVRVLEHMGEGDFCRAYLLNGHDVVRIPKHAEAEHALTREACLLPLLAASLPAPVPRVSVRTDEAGDTLISVHERLTGAELTRALWLSLPDPERALLAHRVGQFMESLHTIDAAVVRDCGVRDVDYVTHVAELRDTVRGDHGDGGGQADRAAVLPARLRQALESWLGRYITGGPLWEYAPSVLHADVSPDHVFVDTVRATITGVIDWGDACIGDPARDFIFLYEDWGPDFLAFALDGYGLEPADRILPRIHMHYIIDQLAWTLEASRQQRAEDVTHGVSALGSALVDLERSAGAA